VVKLRDISKTIIPISCLRRELRQWMRYINNHPDEVIYISRNNKSVGVIMSPELYDDYVEKINVLS